MVSTTLNCELAKRVSLGQSVESMVKIDEDTVVTCSEDGIIRIVSIQPNKLLVRTLPALSRALHYLVI